MLYEYKGKYYIKVSNRYYEVNIEKQPNGEFNVIPNSKKEYIENVDKKHLISTTVEAAYKNIKEPLKSKIID